jgi:hypothetical protein
MAISTQTMTPEQIKEEVGAMSTPHIVGAEAAAPIAWSASSGAGS